MWVHLLADAIQAGHELHRQGQVDIAGGIRRAEFEARSVRLIRILGHADRRAAIAQAEKGVHRRFKTRHQAPIGVGGGIGEGEDRRAVIQQPADVPQRGLAQLAVAGRVEKDILPLLEQVLMKVHTVAGLAVQRLGHEGSRLFMPVRHHLGDILDHLGGIGAAHQAHHRRFDLALAWPAHLVVVILDLDAHLLQFHDHFAAQVEELIFGRDDMIAAVERNQMPMPAAAALPGSFFAFHAVGSGVDIILKRHTVEDVELILRPPATFVRDAPGAHGGFGANGDVAWIAAERQFGVGLERGADQAEGGNIPEGVHEGRGQVGDQDHIAGLDRAQAHR